MMWRAPPLCSSSALLRTQWPTNQGWWFWRWSGDGGGVMVAMALAAVSLLFCCCDSGAIMA
ncbi:hypothetical protein ES332_D05G392100v1 [Gossypium tomentosum]|uniref:Uncharacterized protein n=1 Tax=Gossypium tomentosum TaxID=34277 RepID=A0A5D2L5H1_GOSTO|nr:hypothetical protein ES332_D05G392100v1 [Gossypium tomentosum]